MTVLPINIIGMTPDNLIQQQIEKFWALHQTKQNLQSLVEIVVHRINKSILLISVIFDNELYPAKLFTDVQVEEVNAHSDSWLQEADERLTIRLWWAVVERQNERAIVMLNDTDTCALLLYHLLYLKNNGLKELWQQFRTGEKKRITTLHNIFQNRGKSFTKLIFEGTCIV